MRTLYDCQNARVNGQIIYCSISGKMMAQTEQAEHGLPLECDVCQTCGDFIQTDYLPIGERGWKNELYDL